MFLTLNSWNQRNWENSANSRINTKKKNNREYEHKTKATQISKSQSFEKRIKKEREETGKRKEREKERNGTVSALEWWLRSVCKEGVEGKKMRMRGESENDEPSWKGSELKSNWNPEALPPPVYILLSPQSLLLWITLNFIIDFWASVTARFWNLRNCHSPLSLVNVGPVCNLLSSLSLPRKNIVLNL